MPGKPKRKLKPNGFAFVCDDELAGRIERYCSDARFSSKGHGLRDLLVFALTEKEKNHEADR